MTKPTDSPIPPEGCSCASFWTIRRKHKRDCPLADTAEGRDEGAIMTKHYGRPRAIRRIVCFFTGHISPSDGDERYCYCGWCKRCGVKIEACILHGWVRLSTQEKKGQQPKGIVFEGDIKLADEVKEGMEYLEKRLEKGEKQ